MESKHFSHEHPLVFHQVHQGSQTHCSGCKSPATGNVYVCWQCSYFLHEQCFRATRSLKHPSHPLHPLSLVPCPTYPSSSFFCNSCNLAGDGFSYSCSACEFDIHVHCALTPNPNHISNPNPHLIPSHNYNINPHPQNSLYPPPSPIQAYPPQPNTTLQNQTQNYTTTPYPPPSQEHYPPPTVYPQPNPPLPPTAFPQPNPPPPPPPTAYPQQNPTPQNYTPPAANQPPPPTAYPQPNQPPPPTAYPQQNPTPQNYTPPAANQPPPPTAYPQPNQPPPPTAYPQPNPPPQNYAPPGGNEPPPPTAYPQPNSSTPPQNYAPPAGNQPPPPQPNPPAPTYSTVVTATAANPAQPQSSNPQAKPSSIIKHFSHPHVMKQMEIEETKAKICSACECELSGAAYCCTEAYCTFNLHKSCFDSPHEVRHKSHLEHPLTLLTAPSYNDGFTCNACLKDGKAFVYNCATCAYDLHIDCVQWPDSVHRPDHKHDLTLYYSSPAAAQSGEDAAFMCDVCTNPVHEMAWLYYCRECDFGTHLECVASGLQQQSAKTEDELIGEVELKFAVLQLLLEAKAQNAALSYI